jgi:hypothetical protein
VYKASICDYSVRELTKPDDILNAFAGLQSILTPFLGSFHWGLPGCCFEAALTWRTKDPFLLARRNWFPSWSWTGWTGFTQMVNFFGNERGAGGDNACGYGAEVTYYQVRENGALDRIGGFSEKQVEPRIRSQTRSRYHVGRVDLPKNPPAPLVNLLVF